MISNLHGRWHWQQMKMNDRKNQLMNVKDFYLIISYLDKFILDEKVYQFLLFTL